jgi:hypothetical protein
MAAPVQGCLPDNIDGRLLDLDSDDSSEFCLGYHDARGDNQTSVAEQHDCINPYAAIENLECARKFFTRWWQVLALYNHAGPQAPLYNRDVRKRNKKKKEINQ